MQLQYNCYTAVRCYLYIFMLLITFHCDIHVPLSQILVYSKYINYEIKKIDKILQKKFCIENEG